MTTPQSPWDQGHPQPPQPPWNDGEPSPPQWSRPEISAPPVSGPVTGLPASDGYTLSYPADPNPYGAYPVSASPTAAYSGELVSSASMPVLVQIGEIQVTATSIRTPMGEAPVRGSTWFAQDQWATRNKIPTWAIVCAVVSAAVMLFTALFCILFACAALFSLLFLLAKETVHSGHVTVVVTSGNFQYQTRIQVYDQNQALQIQHQVNYARAVANQ